MTEQLVLLVVPRRRWYDARERAALIECDRLIAEQVLRETPPIRRCPICLGVEIVASPHAHGQRVAA